MSKRNAANRYGFKGPTLQQKVFELLQARGIKGPGCRELFGVGQTWYGDVFLRGKHEPSALKLQEVYEYLTGEPLIK